MTIDLQVFNKLVEDKYLSVQKHPSADLLIWNYTQRCQFEKYWNEQTMMARGLITDLNGNIVARPFKKFFNYGEVDMQLPIEPFKIQEKFDGSLGILYWVSGEPFIATRGSFTSDQAIKATSMLRNNYQGSWQSLNRNYTYLFEILYPENRIVVDYEGREELVMLAVIDTQTGKDLDLHDECGEFPFASYLEPTGTFDDLKKLNLPNKEGFVIKFDSGLRIKLKFDEYVRLHRLVTGVNAKTIWELLKNNQKFDDLIERVPDEFMKWVKDTKRELITKYMAIEAVALFNLKSVKRLGTRKERANMILMLDRNSDIKFSGIMFALLDKKPYDQIIWKMIRPRADKPWKEEVE